MIANMLGDVAVRLNTDYFEHKDELDALAEKVVYTGPIDAYYGYQFEQNPYQRVYSGDASPRECFLFGVSAVDGQIIEGVYSKVVANPFDL